MSSNLPPGCSSSDGGLDHALEAALEELCEAIQTPEEAMALLKLVPTIREIQDNAFALGEDEGRMDERQRAETAWERSQEELAR